MSATFNSTVLSPSDRTAVSTGTEVHDDVNGFQAAPSAATVVGKLIDRAQILRGFRVKCGTLPASGTTTYALYKNNSSVASSSISFTSGSASNIGQVGLNVALAADDTFEIRCTSAGTSAANVAVRALIVNDFTNG